MVDWIYLGHACSGVLAPKCKGKKPDEMKNYLDEEWTRRLNEEILALLNTGMLLNPNIIAENIDRSHGAVTRRLNTLKVGGLVKKMVR